MERSGARGTIEQIRQLAGMRGLMAKPSGKIIETPIKSNFREGLRVLEYFSSTHGARKGLADTALKTADSGYLTRKLADVAQNIVISKFDCGTINGVSKSAVMKGAKIDVSLAHQIRGRVARDTITDVVTDEVIVEENQLITMEVARRIEALGYEKVRVRSPLTCEADDGACGMCYGMDLSRGRLAELGLAIGIIAAQSIGEPGTQLTMRTFHIGGTGEPGADRRARSRPRARASSSSTASSSARTPRAARSASTATACSSSSTTRAASSSATRCRSAPCCRWPTARASRPATSSPAGTRTASRSSPTATAASASRTSSRARR
jgi:DNA-directed RNA polymerase subunit beta'